MADRNEPIVFELNESVLRNQRRVLGVALACYLPAGLIMTAAAIWAAARPASGPAIALIAVSTVQVDYYVVVVIVQLWLASRDLRRAGSAAGRLTLDTAGLDDGLRRVGWPQVTRVRVRRDRVPHVAVTWRRGAQPALSSRRRTFPLR